MEKISSEDTIVALATPLGTGAISVIRVSGPEAISSVSQIFDGRKKLTDAASHTIHYGNIVNRNNKHIDDVLVSVFKEPNSYTGENAIEISTHGNPLIGQKIIDLLLSENIRIAEPGEFTKRAFLNNRLDLTQAEAVVDVIESRTEASLRGSRNQLDGLLSKKVNELREMLVNASSFVELELDFAEEDLEFIDKSELINKIDTIVSEIDSLLATYTFGRLMRDGVNVAIVGQPNVGKSSLLNYILKESNVAIVGQPNVGKSSLLNYILKESRAIVSKIPGTTRDVIREEVSIEGILFKLFDTAGIRVSEDEIEKEGVLRSREAVSNSDIIIMIGDVEQSFSEDLYDELKELNKPENVIKVLNKIDLGNKANINRDLEVSAKTGKGIENLFKLLKEKSIGRNSYSEKSAIVSNLRHYNCLRKAKENLVIAKSSTKENMSGEFISVDLRNAENNLAEIIGVVTTDDILNNVFSKFCIGK
jgi:tRNA modification GTPase